jgi:hypothetical protein
MYKRAQSGSPAAAERCTIEMIVRDMMEALSALMQFAFFCAVNRVATFLLFLTVFFNYQ